MESHAMRRNFAAGLLAGIRVVWPVLSVLIGLMVSMGIIVGLRESWSIQESIYFAFVSGLILPTNNGHAIKRPVLPQTLRG